MIKVEPQPLHKPICLHMTSTSPKKINQWDECFEWTGKTFFFCDPL